MKLHSLVMSELDDWDKLFLCDQTRMNNKSRDAIEKSVD